MNIILPIADGKTLTFVSLTDLAKHYGTMADAYRKSASTTRDKAMSDHYVGKAEAYDIVCWQLHRMTIEM